ncbi:phage major capsid protein [Chitiniphilus eburneus]|uniref:phage major capsid protein n=1 Tax=Chitiniphilus eburneus TaxID=2571148 RepID=UPI0035D0BAC5
MKTKQTVRRALIWLFAPLYAFIHVMMVRIGAIAYDVDPDLDKLQAELKRIGDNVKEVGQKALSEAEKSGKLGEETKKRVDELLVKQGELLAGEQELKARLVEVEQKMDRRSGGGDDAGEKSVGQQLIEAEGFKEFLEALEGRGGKQTNGKFNFAVKAITSATTSAGQAVQPQVLPGAQALPDRRMTVRDLLTPGRTDSNAIEYVRETGFTNNAAPVSETVRKPESNITFELVNTTVKTLAHFMKASKQILADFGQLQSFIDYRLRYGLMYVEELQLLKGSGAGNNLHGIIPQATDYAAPIVIPDATRIDQLRLALLQAELAEYPATGIVLHPSDWTSIELTKTSEGAYIFANPQSIAGPVLWGRPVVATQAMTLGEFLVGAFRLGAQVFDREDANVVIATENEDDFVKNMITIRGEERLAFAVYRPEAFVTGTLQALS